MKSIYNIEENKITLQGFSLGGRSAFKYGLDHPDKFKALLLNTPAFQGIRDANNDPAIGLGYNLEAAKNIPIAFICGTEDPYLDIIQIMFDNLIDNDAIIRYFRVNRMGHSLPPNNETEIILSYLNNPSPVQYDVEFISLEMPEMTKANNIIPKAKVRNLGLEEVTSIKFQLRNEQTSATDEYTWEGSLLPYQHTVIELPKMILSDQVSTIASEIAAVNTDKADQIIHNDSAVKYIIYQDSPLDLPTFEGFEGDRDKDIYWTA